ncbi:hypothetical protein BVX98_02320 [bacterium F11]|nr:hypothetical protein BVX98_02320 [bacterium F11]
MRVQSFPPVINQKVRVRLSRQGPAVYLSHLNQIDVIRRALVQSEWPLVYAQTKRPKMRIGFGPAISVGYASQSELFDVDLKSRLDLRKAISSLQEKIDPGYSVLEVKSVPRFFPSLEQSINVACYQVKSDLLIETKGHWDSFWEKKVFEVKKKKSDREEIIEARSLVRSWTLSKNDLELVLRFGPGRTLKPERIIQAICGFSDEEIDVSRSDSQFRICRTKLCFEKENGDLIPI